MLDYTGQWRLLDLLRLRVLAERRPRYQLRLRAVLHFSAAEAGRAPARCESHEQSLIHLLSRIPFLIDVDKENDHAR